MAYADPSFTFTNTTQEDGADITFLVVKGTSDTAPDNAKFDGLAANYSTTAEGEDGDNSTPQSIDISGLKEDNETDVSVWAKLGDTITKIGTQKIAGKSETDPPSVTVEWKPDTKEISAKGNSGANKVAVLLSGKEIAADALDTALSNAKPNTDAFDSTTGNTVTLNSDTVTALHSDTIEKQEAPVTYYAYAKTIGNPGEKDSAWTSAISVVVRELGLHLQG